MRSFGQFAVVDWSGAIGLRQKGIAIAICGQDGAAPTLVRPDHIWSRHDVLDWLRNDRRSKPKWNSQYKAWEIPAAWFDSVIRLTLRRPSSWVVI